MSVRRSRFARRLTCELLEARDVPSTLAGVVYRDIDADGARDAGEGGYAGATVFVDVNRNGTLDLGEVSTTTDAGGNYSFDVADGTYPVVLAAPAGFAQTGAASVNGPGSGVLGESRVGFPTPEPGVFPGGATNSAGIAWANGAMYVTHVGDVGVAGDSHLYQVNPTTGSTLTGPVNIPDGVGDITFDGTNFWGADFGTDRLIEFSPAGVPGRIYQTGRDINSVEWTGGSLWVTDNTGKTLYQVDRDTGAVGASMALPAASIGGLAFDGRRFWVNNRDTDRVFEVDPVAGVTGRSFDAPGDFAYGLAFDGQFLWLTDIRMGAIVQYDVGAPAPATDVTVNGTGGADLGLAALGSMSGTAFEDRNGNAVRDVGEPGLNGWRVHIDTNGNGRLDLWERAAPVGANGAYSLAGLLPGAAVRLGLRRPGWSATAPVGGAPTVTGTGDALTADFGARHVGLGPVGPETLVNQTTAGDQGYFSSVSGEGQVNSVAADAQGNYVVVWEGAGTGDADGGIFARMFNADGTPRSAEFRVNAAAARQQKLPVVAMAPNGVFAVAWSAWDAGLSRHAVLARVYNANGTPRTGDIQVTAFTNKSTRLSTGIAMDADGDFVVLLHGGDYHGFAQNNGLISFQRYNAQGQAQGKVVQVVDAGLINGSSSVAMDGAGNFVVAWGDGAIYAQRYTASGNKSGAQITTALPGFRPTVARNATGAFVIASGGAIQLFNADGSARTGAVVYQPGEMNTRPSLGIDAAGDVVVSWAASGPDVWAQRFTSTGVAKEPAIRVNSTRTGTHLSPSVAITPRGFVVVWQGPGATGDWDVFAQRFETPTP